jgi:hypothetical protein
MMKEWNGMTLGSPHVSWLISPFLDEGFYGSARHVSMMLPFRLGNVVRDFGAWYGVDVPWRAEGEGMTRNVMDLSR